MFVKAISKYMCRSFVELHFRSQVKPDLVYWTGDIMPHDVWENTREDNLRQFNETLSLLKAYLPKVKVLPAMGNHEGVPVNSFPIPQIKGRCDENSTERPAAVVFRGYKSSPTDSPCGSSFHS